MWVSIALLSFVTLQRLAELALARRNTKALFAEGGREVGAEHYPYLVLLHGCWIAGLWLLAIGRPVQIVWLGIFLLLQIARLWVVATMGDRWTTRIVVMPGRPLVSVGPYRFMAHPNYAVVVGEIAALPLAFGLVGYAALFSILNAIMLHVRIKAENAALKDAMILK